MHLATGLAPWVAILAAILHMTPCGGPLDSSKK